MRDWNLAEWLTIIGFPGIAIGLILAWRHIAAIREASDAAKDGAQAAQHAAEEAREAAQAARASVQDTQRKIANQNLLMMMSQVQRVADDLERDVDEQTALRLASEWVGAAGELHGMLKALDADGAAGSNDGFMDPEDELITLLKQSIGVAGACKNAIIERKEEIPMAVVPLRVELTKIRAASAPILGRMRAYTGETPNV